MVMVSSPLLELVTAHELVPGVDHQWEAGDTGPCHRTGCSHPDPQWSSMASMVSDTTGYTQALALYL